MPPRSRAALIPCQPIVNPPRSAWLRVGRWVALTCFVVPSVGCTKTREQPQLPAGPPPVSNSLTAPSYDPAARKNQVALPSRRWGTKGPAEGSAARPLRDGNTAIATAQSKSLNDDPNGLKRAELQKALDVQLGNLAKCFDKTDVTSVGIYFEADPSGEARGIKVRGAPAEAERCASAIIGGLRFPEFSGNPVPIDFPISISRRVQTVTSTEPGAGPQAPTK